MMKLLTNLPLAWGTAAFHRGLVAFFVGGVLLLSPSSGRANQALLGVAGAHSLDGTLEVARQDSSGKDLPESLSFELVEGPVSEGFTSQVVWVRFTLRREGAQSPRDWWVGSSNPLLRDARLFETSFGGTSVGPEIEPLAEQRRRVFQIKLPDEQPRTFLLRLTGDTALSTTLKVWQPDHLLRSFTTEALVWGGIYGLFVITIAFNFSLWVVTRAAPLGVYTWYATLNFLAAFLTDAWPFQIWPQLDEHVMVVVLGLCISLAPLAGTVFSSSLLELRQRWPRLRRCLIAASAAISFLGILLVLAGYYRTAMPLVQGATMALIVVFLSIAILEALRARRAALFFLLAFSPFYVGVFWRYLRNIGWTEPSFWNDHSYQMGAVVHMVVMSVGIFVKFSKDRREQQETAARLDAQRLLGEEQRELMAMMSHEFRTPLAIAATAVENLLNEASLAPEAQRRLQKVVRAHERLNDLMEGYLTNERLLLYSAGPQLLSFELEALCVGVVQELDETPGPEVLLQVPAGLTMEGDPSLIRIAIRNLLNNARRHSPEGSEVLLHVQPDRKGILIRVVDQGEGVPLGERSAIFERFYRGKAGSVHHGFGLGLYLVKSIARTHGGSVDVCSPPEGGCEFRLWVPEVRQTADPAVASG